MEDISVVSDKNIRAKDSLAANKIFSDWMRVNKKDTKDIVALSKDFNDYMKNSGRKVNFELKKQYDQLKIELDTLISGMMKTETRVDTNDVKIKTEYMRSKISKTNVAKADTNVVEKNTLNNKEPQNIQNIKLLPEEQKSLQEMIKVKGLNKEQIEQLTNSAIAMKANGVEVTLSRLKAIIAIWDQETGRQVDSKKTPEALRKIIKKIGDNIGYLGSGLDSDGVPYKYFDAKKNELIKLSKSGKGVSQYELYKRTQAIKKDYDTNKNGLKSLLDKELNGFLGDTALKVASKLKLIKEVRLPNESNAQFIIRIISSRPSSFGKYEINPDILVKRVLNSGNGKSDISKKLFTADGHFNRDGLVKSMQNQSGGTFTQLELEFLYQKYFFADNLQKFDGNPAHDKEIIKFMGIDHNAGAFASRNAAVQTALNKYLGSSLTVDGDITSYDDRGRPVLSGETYEKLKEYGQKAGFKEKDINSFALLSKSKDMENIQVYKTLMDGRPKMIELAGNNYGKQVQAKYV